LTYDAGTNVEVLDDCKKPFIPRSLVNEFEHDVSFLPIDNFEMFVQFFSCLSCSWLKKKIKFIISVNISHFVFIIYSDYLRKQLDNLNQKLLKVQKANEQLHIKNKEDFNLNVHKLFLSVFTKTQINYFLNDKKKI